MPRICLLAFVSVSSYPLSALKALREKFGRPRCILLFGALFVISQSVIGIILHPLDPVRFFLLQVSFSKEFYLDTFSAWQLAGLMSRYRLHLLPDFFHPFWYGIFLISTIAYLLQRNTLSNRYNHLLWLPVVAGLCDLFENVIQLVFLRSPDYSAISDPLVFLSSLFSFMKWVLAATSVLLIVVFVPRLVFHRRNGL